MLRLIEAGLMHYKPEVEHQPRSIINDKEPVSFEQVTLPVVMFIGSVIISTVLLGLESLYYKLKRRSPQ